MEQPKSYPLLEAEFRKVCRSEASCRGYLVLLRWGKAVSCPYCNEKDKHKAWTRRGGVYKCSGCRREFRVTTGTILQGSRLTLRRWFTVISQMVYDSDLHSVAGFKRQYFPKKLKNSVTVWRSQQKLRRLMWPSGEVLNGDVELGTFRLTSRGGTGHFVLLFVQRRHNRRGHLQLVRVADTPPATIQKCIRENVDPAATLFGTAWKVYAPLREAGYELRRAGEEELLWISNTAKAVEEFFRETHRGAIRASAVDDYLNEFAFRFNARRFAKPGKIFHTLLQRAVRPRPSANHGVGGPVPPNP